MNGALADQHLTWRSAAAGDQPHGAATAQVIGGPAAVHRAATAGIAVSHSAPNTGAHARPMARYQQQLARVLRVGANVAITLSLISPAASVFVIGPVAFRQQGSGTLLVFLVAALVSGCLALGWAELGALYPTASGLYGIVGRVLGREAGFLSLVLQLATFVVGPSAFALAAGQYLAAVWPGVDARMAALVLLAVAIVLGVGGIRFNAVVVSLFLALELGAILVVTVLGLANARRSSVEALLEPQVFAADGTATPAAPGTLLAGVAIGMLAYAGYGAAVVFSEETRGPRRGVARAMLLVLGVAVVAELVPITAALLGAPSLAKLATAPAPMSYLVGSLGGEGLVRVITLALVATLFNALLVTVLDFSRILYGSGRDRVWPAPVSRALAYVHPRTRTPTLATMTLGTAVVSADRRIRPGDRGHLHRSHPGCQLRPGGPVGACQPAAPAGAGPSLPHAAVAAAAGRSAGRGGRDCVAADRQGPGRRRRPPTDRRGVSGGVSASSARHPLGPAGAPRRRTRRGRCQLSRSPSALSQPGDPAQTTMATGAHAFIDKDGRDVDHLLDMIRAVYRHHPWPPGG